MTVSTGEGVDTYATLPYTFSTTYAFCKQVNLYSTNTHQVTYRGIFSLAYSNSSIRFYGLSAYSPSFFICVGY